MKNLSYLTVENIDITIFDMLICGCRFSGHFGFAAYFRFYDTSAENRGEK